MPKSAYEHESRIRGVLRNAGLKGYSRALAYLAWDLPIIITDRFPTAASDGIKLYFNPAFIEPLKDEELLGLIRHECKHHLGGHAFRRQHRDGGKWNVACDMVINEEDRRAGLALPDGGIYLPEKYGCAPNALLPSPETVYDWLEKNPDQMPKEEDIEMHILVVGEGLPPDGKGDAEDSFKGLTDIQVQAKALGRALTKLDPTQNRAQGKDPGVSTDVYEHIKSIVSDLCTVNWRQVLSRFLAARVRQDYSWTVPSRRFIGQGIYLPANQSPGLGHLMVQVDVSSSMPASLVDRILRDIDILRKQVCIDRMSLWLFSTETRLNSRYNLHDRFNPEIVVGGGTSFEGVHKAAHDEKPDVLLICTDGEAPDPSEPYDPAKTVWVVYDGYLLPRPGLVLHTGVGN